MMHSKKISNGVVLACALTLMFSAAPSALAQSLPGGQPQPIQYIVAPESPGPFSTVYIEAQGIGNFLGNSTITWQQDGKTAFSGVGARTFSFTTGAVGKPTTISVSVNSTEYGVLQNSFVFNPSQISLVWEAQTTIPPWYAGKPLASAGSAIRVVAFPTVVENGTPVPAEALSFRWKLNDDVLPAQSGLGRNAFAFTSDQLHASESVSVDVLSGTTPAGHADIVIPLVQPVLILYAHDALRGVLYNRALNSPFAMPSTEMTVRAEPYFFSIDSASRGTLQYAWQLNGQDTSGPNTARGELTLRQTGAGQGSADLSVSLQNNDVGKLLQAAQTTFLVTFGGQSRGSIFGI